MLIKGKSFGKKRIDVFQRIKMRVGQRRAHISLKGMSAMRSSAYRIRKMSSRKRRG